MGGDFDVGGFLILSMCILVLAAKYDFIKVGPYFHYDTYDILWGATITRVLVTLFSWDKVSNSSKVYIKMNFMSYFEWYWDFFNFIMHSYIGICACIIIPIGNTPPTIASYFPNKSFSISTIILVLSCWQPNICMHEYGNSNH